MSFVSFEFLIFFSVFILLYFAIPLRFRMIVLLISSYIFYTYWNSFYLVLIVVSTLIDYFIGIALYQNDNLKSRRLLLLLSICSNLGILFVFKYYGFFDSILLAVSSRGLPSIDLLLPVGISFYTFQSMSYSIDIYRGELAPERNFVRFATYIAFFPQLVAGPIERAGNMLPQFRQHAKVEYARIVDGLRLILWGGFKKIVIADHLAIYVNAVYANPQEYSGWPLIVATVSFAFQIYCDFSAYSDIAIGTARILGFKLMDNFRQPYFSKSISEFWRRWHISLSTWFRDYLYIPLGGNRVGQSRHLWNLLIVFVVSGLWHGANFTFIVWGALHGIYIVIETIWRRRPLWDLKKSVPQLAGGLRMLQTFALSSFAWIFFRANSLQDGLYVAGNLLRGGGTSLTAPLAQFKAISAETYLLTTFGLITLLLFIDWLDSQKGLVVSVGRLPRLARWSLYYVAVGAVFVALNSIDIIQDFIYFQF